MSKRKLLLADDSITIQKVVNLTFADEGIEVIAVGDGDSAMQKINESLPDLILADVNMPGLSGYEICEQIKQNAETREIPVILLVGSFEPFDEARAENIGANDYLTKPFQSIRQLVNKVTELLEAKTKASETADDETDGDDSWQYADTKEMPQEELQTANLGDAAMDDEMIDAEHLGADSEAETEPQNAKTQELPASYVENIEDAREKEEVTYAPVDETEEKTENGESQEEVRETAFAIVSDEDAEDEFQKELPTLEETEETEESPIYSETDHFADETEKPLYAETAKSTPHETPETSETIYEFADTESALETEEVSEAPETVEESSETPQETEKTEEAETSEDSPIYEISDEISESDETDSSESESVEFAEAETAELPSEETEESPVSEVSEQTSEETPEQTTVEEPKEQTVSEIDQEPVETETAETPDSTETQEDETPETEQSEPVKEEAAESKASPIFDADDNLLELPPLVKPVSVAAAPQVSFVSETSSKTAEETPPETEQLAEPATDTTETTAEAGESTTQTEPSTESIIKEQIVEATGSTNITPEMIEAIAQKVAEKLSDRAIREIAWEVVPQMTELIIKKMAEENESKK